MSARGAACVAWHRLGVVWRRVLDAPHLPLAIWLGFVGVGRLITGPQYDETITRTLPTWLTYTWAGALAVGGILIVVGVLAGRTRPESAGQTMHLFGIIVAGIVFAFRGTLDPGGLVAVTALGSVALLRLRILARQRMAEQEAQRLRANGNGRP